MNAWGADELIYVDITREGQYDLERDDLKVTAAHDVVSILRDIATKCFMPLTFGGRIRTLVTVDEFIANGADKVVIDTGAYLNPALITEVAEKYGSQAMVVGIDVRKEATGYGVYINNGRTRVEKSLEVWLQEAVQRGAGEIFLNSIDRDGAATGYDLEVIQAVCDMVNVPVIACGGAGSFADFVQVLQETTVSAVAAGNIFNFTENAYRRAKRVLKEAGIDVR